MFNCFSIERHEEEILTLPKISSFEQSWKNGHDGHLKSYYFDQLNKLLYPLRTKVKIRKDKIKKKFVMMSGFDRLSGFRGEYVLNRKSKSESESDLFTVILDKCQKTTLTFGTHMFSYTYLFGHMLINFSSQIGNPLFNIFPMQKQKANLTLP